MSNNYIIQVQTCESITENSNTESILIYPNPVTENLYLANTFYSEISVEVYDIYGKCILKKFSKIPHEAYLQINFSDFVKGIYLVKVLHKNKLVQSSKIIKE